MRLIGRSRRQACQETGGLGRGMGGDGRLAFLSGEIGLMADRSKSSRFSPRRECTEDEILQQRFEPTGSPLCLVGLSLISVLFIRSAQAYVGGSQWKMQIVWCGIGFSVYFVASWINYQIWMRYAHFFYALAILALLLVFSGPVLYGAQRWIDFGLFKFQPSEIAKWATLVMGASILARSKVEIFEIPCVV